MVEKRFSLIDSPVAVLEVRPALPERFHFRPFQLDPGLTGFQDAVIPPGPAVLGHDLNRIGRGFGAQTVRFSC